MKKQKGFSTLIGILILVAVSIIIFGGVFGYQYYLNQKSNSQPFVASAPQGEPAGSNSNDQTAGLPSKDLSTADWKTYRNEEYGFEFKYPNNLQYLVDNRWDKYALMLWDNTNQVLFNLLIDYSQDYKQSVQEFVEQMNSYLTEYNKQASPKITIISTQTTSINGRVAIEQQESIDTVPGKSIRTYFKQGNAMCSFDIASGYANEKGINQSEIDIYYQILSTFKFTN